MIPSQVMEINNTNIDSEADNWLTRLIRRVFAPTEQNWNEYYWWVRYDDESQDYFVNHHYQGVICPISDEMDYYDTMIPRRNHRNFQSSIVSQNPPIQIITPLPPLPTPWSRD
tara:strand:- start:25344 stop:25682 length:339 start_codon:yes stop_codon:yes gene_type:complete